MTPTPARPRRDASAELPTFTQDDVDWVLERGRRQYDLGMMVDPEVRDARWRFAQSLAERIAMLTGDAERAAGGET